MSLVGGAAVLGLAVSSLTNSSPASAPSAADPNTTLVPVARTTLVERLTLSGTLGYGPASSMAARAGGTLTAVPEPGAVLGFGDQLWRVDDQPVMLARGTVPSYRRMAVGAEGADVLQLEEQLEREGLLDWSPDDDFTSATASVVKSWQQRHGLPTTGVVELGQLVFSPHPLRVDTLTAALGDLLSPGTAVMGVTKPVLRITVETGQANTRYLRVGKKVMAILPDGSTANGVLTNVGPVTESEGGDGKPKVSAEVTIAGSKELTREVGAAASVQLVIATRPDVLAVPVDALLAIPGGGYQVAVKDAAYGGRRLVPVELGLFVDDQIEVSGSGLSEQMQVEVPAG